MIYLDNAATTRPKPPAVGQAVAAAMNEWGNSGRGTHEDALAAARGIYSLRRRLAEFFGCGAAERVVFTQNSTQALNIAISGLFGPGDHVISTDWEHNSVLRPLYRLREAGAELDFLPADGAGRLDYAALERFVRPNTRAVVCNHASNLTGDVIDLSRVFAFTRAHGLLLVVDASQTAGMFPIHMKEMGIDVLCFTGHKGMLGPQGTGGLCVGTGVEIRPFAVGGTGVQSFLEHQPEEYPTRLEAGTLNGHGLAGLAAALEYIEQEGQRALRKRETALARRFYEGVKDLPGVKVYGDHSTHHRAPIVALNLGEIDSAELSDELSERFSIATRPGAHCAPRLHRALGTEEQGIVRFSWSPLNTQEETDRAIEAIRILSEEL